MVWLSRNGFGGYSEYESFGLIPLRVQKLGEEAIVRYAKKVVAREVAKQKTDVEDFTNFAKDPDFPLEVMCEGKLLKGKIVSAWRRDLRIRLDEPYSGEASIHYGHFSPDIFGSEPRTFSGDAIATARRLLIQVYKKQKHAEEHKETIELAERLNTFM